MASVDVSGIFNYFYYKGEDQQPRRALASSKMVVLTLVAIELFRLG